MALTEIKKVFWRVRNRTVDIGLRIRNQCQPGRYAIYQPVGRDGKGIGPKSIIDTNPDGLLRNDPIIKLKE